MRWMREIVLGLTMLATLLSWAGSYRALADERREPVRRGHAPMAYIGSGVTSLVYLPLKVGYAVSGGFIAGLAYLVTAGDEKAFFGVWTPAVKGTYVVTPAMLEGKTRARFVGP